MIKHPTPPRSGTTTPKTPALRPVDAALTALVRALARQAAAEYLSQREPDDAG